MATIVEALPLVGPRPPAALAVAGARRAARVRAWHDGAAPVVPPMLARAHAFLELDRIAVVGVSRDPRAFSRAVLRALVHHGYDAVPVHPAVPELEGRRCFAHIAEAVPRVQAALVLTPPAVAAVVARDCLAAGVREIWFHRGAGPGAATPEAVALCRAAGVEPITDLCPFMVLPEAGWIHRIHARFRRARLPAGGSMSS